MMKVNWIPFQEARESLVDGDNYWVRLASKGRTIKIDIGYWMGDEFQGINSAIISHVAEIEYPLFID